MYCSFANIGPADIMWSTVSSNFWLIFSSNCWHSLHLLSDYIIIIIKLSFVILVWPVTCHSASLVVLHLDLAEIAQSKRLRAGWPKEGERFLSSPKFQIDSGAHPALYSVDTREFILGIKRLGLEIGYLPPVISQVRNTRSLITSVS
jgi:hypothetical protein